MKVGWVARKLGEITTKIGSGATPLGGEEAYKQTGISLIRSLNVYDDGFREAKLAKIDEEQAKRLSNVIVEPNDVLLNITGASVARCCLAPEELIPARVNQHVSIIRPVQEKLFSPFLRYLLVSKTYKDRLLNTGEEGGSTRQAITKAQLQEFIIEYPESLPEQKRIVSILDIAFDGIATAKANAEKNLQNARALFESHLQSVFSQHGEGWVEKPLGETCEVKDGTHYSPKYVADGIPFVTQKNIREDGLSFKKTKFIRQEDHDDFYRRSNVAHGDILISMIGANRGMACIVDDERVFSIKNVGLVKRNLSINQQFLLYFLKSPQAGSYVQAASKGGAQEFVGLTELRKFPVPLPSLERQNTLAENFQSLRGETQRLEAIYQQKLTALEALKESLLHQAFTGKL